MNPHGRRQIRDIQFRAEHLMNRKPTLEEIEEFDQYNEELKKYLLENLKDRDLIDRVIQIPRIMKESDGQVIGRDILGTFFAMFASAFTAYFKERQQIESCKDAIREARGKYATIEFLTRNV